jgi:carbon monoxide dehydrogenase subunit G
VTTRPPAASSFTPAPLRNRLRLELEAPVPDVWALVGDLARFPEYSFGLERVEAKLDSLGRCEEYVCHFKPLEDGGERIVTGEVVRWYEPPRGYASSGAGGDAFGLANDLHLVLLEASNGGTLVTWDEYFDARDLDMKKAHFDEALADTGENLTRRFGGRVVERVVES